ncbi:MAG: hypothetical protein MK108_04310 [Mariniblastus sp.]|nr:hypothetical protein [Mariniblastus sp.]
MFKKLTLGVLGVVLIGGLLFGNRIVPYAKTAYEKVRATAQDTVPISFQIDAAKEQLKKIDPEIKDMVWQIAKEKAQIKRLSSEMVLQEENMSKRYDEMITLRKHLETGDEFYVATNGKAYANDRVKEDLAHRFSVYKTAEKTFEKSKQIQELREQALETALVKLEQAQSIQRELQVQIENLNARQRMVDVAKTASNIHIDDSQLARTQGMIDEISAKIDTEEEMLNLAPKYFGQIPVSQDEIVSDRDILQEMDDYFNQNDNQEVVNK